MKAIAKNFFKNLASKFEAAAFGSVVVADQEGTELFYEGEGDLEVGTALYILDENGEQMPAPEGEHTLEDARVITVDAAGVVTAIVDAEEPAEEEEVDANKDEEEEKEEEMAAEENDTEDFSKLIKEETSKILEAFNKQVKANQDLTNKLAEVETKLAKLQEEVEVLGEQPAAKPEAKEFKHVERPNVNPIQHSLINK